MSRLSLGRGLSVLTALAGSSVSLGLEMVVPSSLTVSLPFLQWQLPFGAAEALRSREKQPGGCG